MDPKHSTPLSNDNRDNSLANRDIALLSKLDALECEEAERRSSLIQEALNEIRNEYQAHMDEGESREARLNNELIESQSRCLLLQQTLDSISAKLSGFTVMLLARPSLSNAMLRENRALQRDLYHERVRTAGLKAHRQELRWKVCGMQTLLDAQEILYDSAESYPSYPESVFSFEDDSGQHSSVREDSPMQGSDEDEPPQSPALHPGSVEATLPDRLTRENVQAWNVGQPPRELDIGHWTKAYMPFSSSSRSSLTSGLHFKKCKAAAIKNAHRHQDADGQDQQRLKKRKIDEVDSN